MPPITVSSVRAKIFGAPSLLPPHEKMLVDFWVGQKMTAYRLENAPSELGSKSDQTQVASRLKNMLLTEAEAEIQYRAARPSRRFQSLNLPPCVDRFEWIGADPQGRDAQAGTAAKSYFSLTFKTPLNGVKECVLPFSQRDVIALHQVYGRDPKVRKELCTAIAVFFDALQVAATPRSSPGPSQG